MLNCRAVGTRHSFQVFRQNTWFLKNNRVLYKIFNGILHYLISTIKLQRSQSVKTNFKFHVSYLNPSFQGVRRLFFLAYAIAAGAANYEADIKNNKKYFLPRGKNNNCNVQVDERNFYNQPINDLIKQYDEVRKVSTVQSDDYRTGCLLDCPYFQNDYKLIAVDVDPRVIRQIAFQGVVGERTIKFLFM